MVDLAETAAKGGRRVPSRRRIASLAFCAALLAHGSAAALEVAFAGVTGPADPVVLTLPPGTDPGVIATLAVELDGADVTALLTVDGDRIAIAPVTPLAPGEHYLTLYRLTETDFEVIGQWAFTIGAAAGQGPATGDGTQAAPAPGAAEASWGFKADALHQAGAIANNDGVNLFLESAGQAQATALDGALRAGGNYLLATEEEARLTDNAFDLGEYFVEYTHRDEDLSAILRLGHQTLDYDDVLISDLNRRGAGVQIGLMDDRLAFSIFGVNPQEGVLGADNLVGLDTRDERIFGAAVSFQPFSETDFRITATGYSGRGSDLDGTTAGEGSGAALSATAGLIDGRLRLAAGGAATRFDPDAEAALASAETGYAAVSTVSYDVLTGISDDGESAPALTISGGYERVDEDYFSYAMPSLAVGRESLYADAAYAWDAMSFQVRALHQTDNVLGLPALATNRLIDLSATAYYTPFFDSEAPAWLGQTGIDATFSFQTQDEIEAAMPALPAEDYTAYTIGLGFSSTHEQWGWTTRYDFATYSSALDPALNYTSHGITAGVSYFPGAGLMFDISGTTAFIDPGVGQSRTDFDLATTLTAPLIEDTLALSSSYMAAFTTGGDGIEGGDLSADLAWTLTEGVDIVARAGLTHGDNVLTNDDIAYYGGLVLRISTPISLGSGLEGLIGQGFGQ